jgi:hypothetical protein
MFLHCTLYAFGSVVGGINPQASRSVRMRFYCEGNSGKRKTNTNSMWYGKHVLLGQSKVQSLGNREHGNLTGNMTVIQRQERK